MGSLIYFSLFPVKTFLLLIQHHPERFLWFGSRFCALLLGKMTPVCKSGPDGWRNRCIVAPHSFTFLGDCIWCVCLEMLVKYLIDSVHSVYIKHIWIFHSQCLLTCLWCLGGFSFNPQTWLHTVCAFDSLSVIGSFLAPLSPGNMDKTLCGLMSPLTPFAYL